MKSLACVLMIAAGLAACSTNPVNPPSVPPGDSFSLLIFSDPQLYWYNRPDGACGQDDNGPNPDPPVGTCPYQADETKSACVERCGADSNTDQVASIDAANGLTWPQSAEVLVHNGDRISPAVGAIVNGDLTAFWHRSEKNAYEDYYQNNESTLPEIPVFAGLGNHDYYNNVCDCGNWAPYTNNACARNAVKTIRRIYDDVEGIDFDACSMAYSFNINEFHVVQLHLNPSYSVDLNNYHTQCRPNQFNISSNECDGKNIIAGSISWLTADLSAASAAGQSIILNMHAAGDDSDGSKYWGPNSTTQQSNKQRLADLIAENNVVAIFGGHIHAAHGYMGSYQLNDQNVLNVHNNEVPWFRSGASEYYTYLVAEFGQDPQSSRRYMNVGVVSSENGGSVFIDGNGQDYGATAMPPATFWLD